MSVTTTVDIKLEVTRFHIEEAYKNILEVLNPDTWGHHDLDSSYLDNLHAVLKSLRETKKALR